MTAHIISSSQVPLENIGCLPYGLQVLHRFWKQAMFSLKAEKSLKAPARILSPFAGYPALSLYSPLEVRTAVLHAQQQRPVRTPSCPPVSFSIPALRDAVQGFGAALHFPSGGRSVRPGNYGQSCPRYHTTDQWISRRGQHQEMELPTFDCVTDSTPPPEFTPLPWKSSAPVRCLTKIWVSSLTLFHFAEAPFVPFHGSKTYLPSLPKPVRPSRPVCAPHRPSSTDSPDDVIEHAGSWTFGRLLDLLLSAGGALSCINLVDWRDLSRGSASCVPRITFSTPSLITDFQTTASHPSPRHTVLRCRLTGLRRGVAVLFLSNPPASPSVVGLVCC
ncbi:unnamed protein product [Lota lota]